MKNKYWILIATDFFLWNKKSDFKKPNHMKVLFRVWFQVWKSMALFLKFKLSLVFFIKTNWINLFFFHELLLLYWLNKSIYWFQLILHAVSSLTWLFCFFNFDVSLVRPSSIADFWLLIFVFRNEIIITLWSSFVDDWSKIHKFDIWWFKVKKKRRINVTIIISTSNPQTK